MDQASLVAASLMVSPRAGSDVSSLPRRWPRRQYVVDVVRPSDVWGWRKALPDVGAIVETRPGVFWRVLSRTDDEGHPTPRVVFGLEPVRAHSLEAHGVVCELRGGALV